MKVGLLLAQVGEFSFVVLDRAVGLHLVDAATGQTLVSAAAVTMVPTPALAALGRWAARRVLRNEVEMLRATESDFWRDHVVIAGYGRVGRAIARVLATHGVPFVALDLDPERVGKAREDGQPVFYGDASQGGVLRSVGIGDARAVVVTLNHSRAAERTVSCIRQMMPNLPVIARAHDSKAALLLGDAGATAVIPETMEASLQMAGLALRHVGVASEDVDRTLTDQRRHHHTSTSP